MEHDSVTSRQWWVLTFKTKTVLSSDVTPITVAYPREKRRWEVTQRCSFPQQWDSCCCLPVDIPWYLAVFSRTRRRKSRYRATEPASRRTRRSQPSGTPGYHSPSCSCGHARFSEELRHFEVYLSRAPPVTYIAESITLRITEPALVDAAKMHFREESS